MKGLVLRNQFSEIQAVSKQIMYRFNQEDDAFLLLPA